MNHRDIPKHWKERIAVDPDSDKSKAYLAIQAKLRRVEYHEKKVDAAVKKSHVGTRLLHKFKRSVGAVPCSGCKQTMIRLNLLDVATIRDSHDEFVAEIEKNARKAKASWWANVMKKADEWFADGAVTKLLISKFLSDACYEDEHNLAIEDTVLDDNPAPDGVGGTPVGEERPV